MKTLIVLSFLLTSVVISFSNCKKNKPATASEQLPPETQTGANTFGCLIDGKLFIPKGNPLGGPIKKAQYQFVNGKQVFGVSGSFNDGNVSELVGIIGDSVLVAVGTFNLSSQGSGKLRAGYSYLDLTLTPIQYETNEINRGQLTIKKFDTVNQIMSGTFWFDALDSSTGKIVQIREGRFDMPYVR